MQKFLVGPDIGGFHVTKKAVQYLADQYASDSREHKALINRFAELANENGYGLDKYEHGLVKIDEEDELYGYQIDNAFREMLLNAIEKLDGNYSELDNLNNCKRMRIVFVDDGIACRVTEDEEMGCEYVTEIHSGFFPADDAIYLAYNIANKYMQSITEPVKCEVRNVSDVMHVAFNDEIALVKIAKQTWDIGENYTGKLKTASNQYIYFIANFVSYYIETDDHPKKFYEISDELFSHAYGGNIVSGKIDSAIESCQMDTLVKLYNMLNQAKDESNVK